MEYRRTNPHPSLPKPPLSHTHTHTPTQSRWTPGPSPQSVQSHWAPCAFTGPVRDTPTIPLDSLCIYRDALTIPLVSLCVHRHVLAHKPSFKMPPTTFLPHPGLYVFILHILLETTTRPSVCARQVRGSILQNSCRLVAYLCRVVSIHQ